jgi:hypothetical protein
MISCGMVYILSFMNIGSGGQTILSICFRNFRGCNVITDVRNLLITSLMWDHVPNMHTKFRKIWFRHSKVDKGISMWTKTAKPRFIFTEYGN